MFLVTDSDLVKKGNPLADELEGGKAKVKAKDHLDL